MQKSILFQQSRPQRRRFLAADCVVTCAAAKHHLVCAINPWRNLPHSSGRRRFRQCKTPQTSPHFKNSCDGNARTCRRKSSLLTPIVFCLNNRTDEKSQTRTPIMFTIIPNRNSTYTSSSTNGICWKTWWRTKPSRSEARGLIGSGCAKSLLAPKPKARWCDHRTSTRRPCEKLCYRVNSVFRRTQYLGTCWRASLLHSQPCQAQSATFTTRLPRELCGRR